MAFKRNIKLHNCKLSLELSSWFEEVKVYKERPRSLYKKLEPGKSGVYRSSGLQREQSEELSLTWLAFVDNIITKIQEYEGYIYIPDLAPVA